METCPKCHNLLRTGPSYTTTESDGEYTNIPLYCFNKACENFVGDAMDEVKKIDVVKNRVETNVL